MIEKQREIATLEVTKDNTVIIRERVAIVEDGEEISHKFEQRNIHKDDNIENETERVQKIVKALR